MSNPSSPETYLEFVRQFGTREACIGYFAKWRWPQGFRCPACGHEKYARLRTRELWECLACGRQTSVTAGTALHRSKVRLEIWAYAFWLLARRKQGISALQFQRETGLGNYKTAWALLHKARRVLFEREEYKLGRPPKEGEGRGTLSEVEIDESVMRGDGARGRRVGRGGSTVLVAVERKTIERRGKVVRVAGSARATVIPDASSGVLQTTVEQFVDPDAHVVTDGWYGYRELSLLGYSHDIYELKGIAERTGGRRQQLASRLLPKVHLLFSNLKTWLRGTFHGVSKTYLPMYLAEFIYRFNRRHRDPATFGFIVRRAMQGRWTPIAGLSPEASA